MHPAVARSPVAQLDEDIQRTRAAIKPTKEAWIDCTMHEAVRLAKSSATIEQVIQAVYASCSEEERRFSLALIQQLGGAGPGVMYKIKNEVARQHLTRLIIKARR
ncbi:MAG: hypothetical protein ACHQAQ_11775 [Hyphomicrobiales bacterium]